MKILLIISILFTNLAFADCPNFRFIDAGEPAPCDGAFFNKEAEEELKRQHSTMKGEIKNLEKKLELTELQVGVVEEKANIFKAEMQRQEQMRKRMEGDLRKGILLGVAGTALAIFLAGQLR